MESKNKKLRSLAFIMDGNRRYAQSKGLSKLEGHKFGIDTMIHLVQTFQQSTFELDKMIFWALSKQNLTNRSQTEIEFLFNLFRLDFNVRLKKLTENNVKIQFMGQ
mmetsp:Transcript_65192/g.140855  ORF Transcript_65192/g.140855 Transcript_65192/m.140855 type:complete len:106 (+) Transcript_65192:218-535(+)